VADMFSKDKRSEVMRAIRGKNTKPEMFVRRLLHRMGYRYRLHQANLPGKPDLVFAGRRKVIFVHGCFWHGHAACAAGRIPKTNGSYWASKILRNQTRDARSVRKLRRGRWGVAVVWECQLSDIEVLRNRLVRFLES
jgi:DNA mismatch endonuclease, patch repair protein